MPMLCGMTVIVHVVMSEDPSDLLRWRGALHR